jgi:hypothetical protein
MRAGIVPVLLLAAGCAAQPRHQPEATPIMGPDGAPMLHVSCGEREGSCYRIAGEICRQGYAITPAPGRPGNFLVRCRFTRAGWAPVAAPGPAAAPTSYTIAETVQPWPDPTPKAAYPPVRPAPSPLPPPPPLDPLDMRH